MQHFSDVRCYPLNIVSSACIRGQRYKCIHNDHIFDSRLGEFSETTSALFVLSFLASSSVGCPVTRSPLSLDRLRFWSCPVFEPKAFVGVTFHGLWRVLDNFWWVFFLIYEEMMKSMCLIKVL